MGSFDSLRLHPIRYRRGRPHAREIGRATSGTNATPTPWHDQTIVQAVMHRIQRTHNAYLDRQGRTHLGGGAMQLVIDEMLISLVWGQHRACGATNFVLTPALAQLLSFTDLDGVRMDDLTAPFTSLYVHFGGADVGALPGPPNQIDGAYLRATGPTAWQVVFTSELLGKDENWPATPAPFLEFILHWDRVDQGLIGVFRKAIARLMAVEQTGVVGGKSAVFSGVIVQSDDYLAQAAPRCEVAMRLLANAVCYIGADPEISDAQYPADFPETLRSGLAASSKSERQRANAQALDEGFQLIRWLGPRHARAFGHERGLLNTSPDRRQHWRRGHWRRQPYGPGRLKKRLIWVRPCFVGGIDDLNPPDRAYLVEPLARV